MNYFFGGLVPTINIVWSKKNPQLRFYKTNASLRGRSITMVISWSSVRSRFSTVLGKSQPIVILHVSFDMTVISKSTKKLSFWFGGAQPNLLRHQFYLRHHLLQLHHLTTVRGWLVPQRALETTIQRFNKRPINQYQFSDTQRFTDHLPVHNARYTICGQFIHKTDLFFSLTRTSLFLLPLLMIIHSGFMVKIVPLKQSVWYSTWHAVR